MKTIFGNTLAGMAMLAIGGLATAADLPLGKGSLFGDDKEIPDKPSEKAAAYTGRGTGLKGLVQFELARTIDSPVHWSKMRTRAEVGSQGTLGEGLKWKLGARFDVDGVYGYNDFYPGEVRRDQRFRFALRENYVDFSAGTWDFRLGRQHVVWGEMVGLFFADVVSARDMREFILPEFEMLRIPQWAGRAEYFKDDFHAELLWVPVASYDEIGKPGAEFYPVQPAPPGFASVYRNEVRPARSLAHGNYGIRLSTLRNGWDVSGFYYRSMDNVPAFRREVVLAPTPAFIFEPRHERISQVGGTLAKDFGSVVLKGEVVYTRGRQFTVLRLTDDDGLVQKNSLDWAVGLDFSLPAETRFNVQLFQRAFSAHDPDMIPKKRESGYSLYLTSKLSDRVEAHALLISSLERNDWLFRPKLTWNFEKNWRALLGADLFKGPPLGLFGIYDSRDRLYTEVRYSF